MQCENCFCKLNVSSKYLSFICRKWMQLQHFECKNDQGATAAFIYFRSLLFRHSHSVHLYWRAWYTSSYHAGYFAVLNFRLQECIQTKRGKHTCHERDLLIHLLFWDSSHTPCSLQHPKKKSIGVRWGEHGGHSMLPLLPNHDCIPTFEPPCM